MFRNILKLSVPKLAKKTAALRIPSFHSRALSTIKVTYVEPDGNEVTLTADPNADDKPTLMTLAVKNKVDMEGACEGQIACSTCHVILPKEVYDQLAKTNPISDEELDMLVRIFFALCIVNLLRALCMAK